MNNFDITKKIKKQFTEDCTEREIKTPNEFIQEARDTSKKITIYHPDFVACVDEGENLFIYLDAESEKVLERVTQDIINKGKRSMR